MHPHTYRKTPLAAAVALPLGTCFLSPLHAKQAARSRISCGNLAHAFAASGDDKPVLKGLQRPNIGIVSAYNDMLSAHQPSRPRTMAPAPAPSTAPPIPTRC